VAKESGRLEAGQEAPLFEATTLRGERISLADRLDQPLWLAFFRFASCPLCNFRIHQLVGQWPDRFAHRKFRMLGVFQSPAEKLDTYVSKHEPQFTVVANPEMDLYRLYGVESSIKGAFSGQVMKSMVGAAKAGLPLMGAPDGPSFRIPADFLIAPGGTIHTVFYGSNMADHIPFETVDAWLDELNGPEQAATG
jgi:thioredoxin-dependent peroxiredoxin